MDKFLSLAVSQNKTRHLVSSFGEKVSINSFFKCLVMFAALGVTACGGGDSTQEKGLLSLPDEPGVETPAASPTPTPTSEATPTPTSSPTATVSPTATPSPTATVAPTATPAPTPTPSTDPANSGALSKPVLEVVGQDAAFAARWNDVNAEGYRLLYWADGAVEPSEAFTGNTAFLSEVLGAGQYMVLLEAFDENGNAFFSDPAYVEVQ